MPIHRLGEKPSKHAVLGNITRDSDGKPDRFADRRDVKKTLPLHTVREVLDCVEFDAESLLGKLRTDVESAVREGRMDYEGAGRLLRFYEDGLHGYTYLEG